MKVATDNRQWWRDKVNRIGQQCFNATCATWATHLLDKFVLTEVRTLEAPGLPELAVQLAIPRKYLARPRYPLLRGVTVCIARHLARCGDS